MATPLWRSAGCTFSMLRWAIDEPAVTAGSSIAHRNMEKVHPADRHSGVAIAGPPAGDGDGALVPNFQLEHYEKVEETRSAWRAKPTNSPRWCVPTWPWPCRALWWSRCSPGSTCAGKWAGSTPTTRRVAATKRPISMPTVRVGRDARTTIKLGWKPGPVASGCHGTRRPGPVAGRRRRFRHRRCGIYPTVATITAAGFARADDAE